MALDDTAITLWFHYEEIAMHFNELVMQYRLQLIGGLGALGALFAYLVESKKEPHRLMTATILTLLLIVFGALVSLDVFYYQVLLDEAVKVLINFEKGYEELNMSTALSQRFEGSTNIINTVYFVLLALFTLFTAFSWFAVYNDSDSSN